MKAGILPLLGLFAALAPATGQAAVDTLTLPQAIDFALLHSPALDSAQKSQLVSELSYKSAVAKMLPSLDFATTDGLENNIPIASTANTTAGVSANPTAPWYSSVSLGLTENLYDNGVSLTNTVIADLTRDLANVNLAKARDGLALNVASEFYHFSLLTALLDVKKQQHDLLARQFLTLTSQYHQGLKLKADYLRLKAQVQRAEIDIAQAIDDLAQSRSKLRDLLGVPVDEPAPPDFTPQAVSREKRFGFFLGVHAPPLDAFYDFHANKIQEDINQKAVDLAVRNYWPQLNLSSGITYSNANYLNSPLPFSAGHEASWDALVTVDFNFWDWGTRARSVEIAAANRDIQSNQLRQNLLDDNSQIESLMGDFARIGKNYQLTSDLLDLEQETTDDLERQYHSGKVTYLDLVTELDNLLDAKTQFYTAYFDALTSQAKYAYYQGKLYDSIVGK